jgi:hypothetical protein
MSDPAYDALKHLADAIDTNTKALKTQTEEIRSLRDDLKDYTTQAKAILGAFQGFGGGGVAMTILGKILGGGGKGRAGA